MSVHAAALMLAEWAIKPVAERGGPGEGTLRVISRYLPTSTPDTVITTVTIDPDGVTAEVRTADAPHAQRRDVGGLADVMLGLLSGADHER